MSKRNLSTAGLSRNEILAWLAIALLPALVTAIKMSWFGLAFPYWDAWHFADFLARYDAGQLGLLDFWAQHNEHRPLFPRMLMFLLALFSGWNVGLELAANWLLALALLLSLLLLLRRSTRPDLFPWFAVGLSCLVFSWVQMENWVWGWQIQVFMSTAAVAGGVVLLGSATPGIAAFVGAIALGVVASYSFANGLLYWFAVGPLVVMAPTLTRTQRILRGLVWVAVAILTIQSYLFDYHTPEVSPGLSSILDAPMAFAGYFVLYIGAPVVGIFTKPAWHGVAPPVATWAFLPGLAGLVAMGALKVALFRRGTDTVWRMAPWLSLAAFAIFSAGLTAAGRAAFGMEHALTSRYTTIGTLFWCALAGLVALAMDEWRIREADHGPGRSTQRGLAALVLLLLIGQSHNSQAEWEQAATWKRMGWEAIQAGHDSPLYLGDLAENPEALAETQLPFLRATGRAGLSETPQRDPLRAQAFIAESDLLAARALFGQAVVYLQTALVLDPGNTDAQEKLTALTLRIEELRERD